MERGRIDLDSLDGGFDLQSTLESGQTYRWSREDGQMYDELGAYGGEAWYWTTVSLDGTPEVVRARQRTGTLEWESSIDAEPHLRRSFRLDDDLDAIRASSPDDAVVQDSYDAYWGMRLVRDPPFTSLIPFICSAQMRVERIHSMQTALRETYGHIVEFDGRTYHTYPTPAALAETTEADLRDLGLGYRAPYVRQSAEMVASGTVEPVDARALSYENAREFLTRFVGVGDKVADCVLLFSLDFLEAVPLDTWMKTTIAEYFPACDRGSYTATSSALRDALGGEYAGYAQTYVFHYLRSGGDSR